MQLVLELPDALGERLSRLGDPNTFLIQLLSQVLPLESQAVPQSYRIEDAFGLYKPKRSVSLEEMEEAIVKGALQ